MTGVQTCALPICFPVTIAPLSLLIITSMLYKTNKIKPRSTLYELYIDVETAPRPTVTVTAPSGTVTDTSFPSVTWTPVFSDGSPQSAYEIKIFDSTTYGGASFSPVTSEPTIETGIITFQ